MARGTLLVAPEGDQLVVTKLDALGRSLENHIQLSKELHARGVDLATLDVRLSGSDSLAALDARLHPLHLI
ncbi:recombinase family protein [Streptomyces sp. NPDC051104]|uniref:recombinase family protein n=1 Tax=Streptomyces sp. NPDC051104 TaxID=3155044 RepID=UPI0034222A5D